MTPEELLKDIENRQDQAWGDPHYAESDDLGWSVTHPAKCRADLNGCHDLEEFRAQGYEHGEIDYGFYRIAHDQWGDIDLVRSEQPVDSVAILVRDDVPKLVAALRDVLEIVPGIPSDQYDYMDGVTTGRNSALIAVRYVVAEALGVSE